MDKNIISSWKLLIPVLIMGLIIYSGSMVLAATEPGEILKQAPTAKDFPDDDAAIMVDKAVIELTEEGNVITRYQTRIKVFTRQGRKEFGEIRIPFSSELEDVKLNYARTINQDGSVTEPDKDSIKVNTHPVAKGAPMYSDVKVKTISMPALKNDSIIDYSYTKVSKPMMENNLFDRWYFKTSAPVIISGYMVKVPQDKNINYKSVNGKFEPEVSIEDGKKIYTWNEEDLDKIYNEAGRPPLAVLSPGIIVSTENNWQTIAEWYAKLIAEKLKPGSEIKDKVNEIIQGLDTDQEKIAHIFDYVATKIRYVALEFGLGGVQPYSVNKTFRNKYGDCKDQASLLTAMLREAGIDAHVTLIMAGNARKTHFDGPATLGGFNHAITAVKENNGDDYFFLDPTCDTCNWQYLPDMDRQRQVMVIKGQEGVITQTPAIDYTASGVNTEMEVDLNDKGDIKVAVDLKPEGKWTYVYRSFFQGYDRSEKRQIFQQVLSQDISGASLEEIEHSDTEDNFVPFKLHITYKKPEYASQTAGLTIFKVPNTLRIPFSRNFSYYTSKGVEERRYPVLLTAGTYRDRVVIHIPDNTGVRLPQDKEIENDVAAYRSSYSSKDNRIIITRKFKVKRNILEVKDAYSQGKKVIEIMRSDEEEKIVLD